MRCLHQFAARLMVCLSVLILIPYCFLDFSASVYYCIKIIIIIIIIITILIS